MVVEGSTGPMLLFGIGFPVKEEWYTTNLLRRTIFTTCYAAGPCIAEAVRLRTFEIGENSMSPAIYWRGTSPACPPRWRPSRLHSDAEL